MSLADLQPKAKNVDGTRFASKTVFINGRVRMRGICNNVLQKYWFRSMSFYGRFLATQLS